MPIVAEVVDHVIGVDTHKHTHTAVTVSAIGVASDAVTISTDRPGYQALFDSVSAECGDDRIWAVEGTGCYGAGLVRFLTERREWVVEVERPDRPRRRRPAKSDAIDAERAAREVLGTELDRLIAPRADGDRAALATLLMARRAAVDTAVQAEVQLQAAIVAAPDQLRDRLRGLKKQPLLRAVLKLRRHPNHNQLQTATITALRSLAARANTARTEAADLKNQIGELITTIRPDLLDQYGIGPINAATIYCAWSHPGRFRNEAAFANLAGVAPIPASSGLTTRHRLNRRGDRQLNQALHNIARTRINRDPNTQTFVNRKRAEGKTDREIKRTLTRYIARQIFKLLETPLDNT